MKKSEFISAVAAAANVTKKEAEAVVDATFATLSQEMKNGESVRIAGFGTFTTRKRSERTSKNPRTGEIITVSATNVPTFKAGKELKTLVNE